MATTIAISCPKCENPINAPADLVGKKIRCKECKSVFVVKAPPEAERSGSKPVPAKKPQGAKPAAKTTAELDEEMEDGKNPYAVTKESLKPRCPFCAKELDDDSQVICLNCGYNRRTRERIATEKTMEPTGGEWFIHLLPGIICALVTLFIIVGIPLDFILRTPGGGSCRGHDQSLWSGGHDLALGDLALRCLLLRKVRGQAADPAHPAARAGHADEEEVAGRGGTGKVVPVVRNLPCRTKFAGNYMRLGTRVAIPCQIMRCAFTFERQAPGRIEFGVCGPALTDK